MKACMDGMLDILISTENVDANVFCEYIERCLLPHLLPFNSINPRSVVVLDNASIHHAGKVACSCLQLLSGVSPSQAVYQRWLVAP